MVQVDEKVQNSYLPDGILSYDNPAC